MKNMIKFYGLVACALVFLSGCSELELGSHIAKKMTGNSTPKTAIGYYKVGSPYKIKGRYYRPKAQYNLTETGIASWYGPGFHGKMTANGEIFNKHEYTAAHRTLQLPSIIRVTNLNNGRSIILRVNDRGPFAHDRILDVSEKAAETLGFKHAGTSRIRIDVMDEESRIVASAAKRGLSTRGTEIALNRNQSINDLKAETPLPPTKPYGTKNTVVTHAPVPVTQVSIDPQADFHESVLRKITTKPTHIPRPIANQNIFIQAGAFSAEDNALTLKTALYNVSEPVNVHRNVKSDGDILYRVKIGPVATVEKANKILTMLNKQGRDAKIIATKN